MEKYHIVGHRRLFFAGSVDNEAEVVIRKTDRLKEARGLVKQETNSHLEMLDHHEYFALHFDMEVQEDGMQRTITGEDDEGTVRYIYTVKAVENDDGMG